MIILGTEIIVLGRKERNENRFMSKHILVQGDVDTIHVAMSNRQLEIHRFRVYQV